MTSLWIDHAPPVADDVLPAGDVLDDVVVGGGLSGLTTALLLARAGRRVAVVEARTVGAVTTGHTTGKVSLLQGTKLSRMRRFQSRSAVQAYVDGSLEGQQWLLRFCDDHGVPYQVRDAVTYASSPEQRSALEKEMTAAREAGLDVRMDDDLDVPFPQHGGVVLGGQAQINSMDVVAALVEQLRAHGGSVHQGHRVTGLSRSGRPTVRLEDGTELRAEHVVLATGMPILDRSLYFAKLEPMRSYALAFDVAPGSVPEAMYLSAGQPSRSVRTYPLPDGRESLVVGGSGHDVGRTPSEKSHVDELRSWTASHFAGAVETHAWSAQDYRSHDSFPYIGAMPRGGGRVFVATGLDKWGMSGAVMAARSLSGQMLGAKPSWQGPMSRRVTGPRGAARLAAINAEVGVAWVAKGVQAALRPAPSTPPAEGEGVVGRSGVAPTAVSTVDGRTCAVSALCTHLGGVLSWNDAEKSWDCPLHGSRFTPSGEVLEGPATKPLGQK